MKQIVWKKIDKVCEESEI